MLQLAPTHSKTILSDQFPNQGINGIGFYLPGALYGASVAYRGIPCDIIASGHNSPRLISANGFSINHAGPSILVGQNLAEDAKPRGLHEDRLERARELVNNFDELAALVEAEIRKRGNGQDPILNMGKYEATPQEVLECSGVYVLISQFMLREEQNAGQFFDIVESIRVQASNDAVYWRTTERLP